VLDAVFSISQQIHILVQGREFFPEGAEPLSKPVGFFLAALFVWACSFFASEASAPLYIPFGLIPREIYLMISDSYLIVNVSQFLKLRAMLVIVVIIGGVIVFGQITKGKTQPAQNMVPTSVMTTVETPIPTPIPSPTPVPTPVPRPQYIIPSTGTWVRIQYPGNFVGYVRIRGIFTLVNNTVEQFIQLPASEGVISGSIGKQDGSVDNLTVGIYKDGALVFTKNTRKPLGEIDFQYTL